MVFLAKCEKDKEMTLSVVLGILVFMSPFIAFTIYMIKEDGWGMVLKVWGIVLLLGIIGGIAGMLIKGVIVF